MKHRKADIDSKKIAISNKKERNIKQKSAISSQELDKIFYATAVLHLCGSMDIQLGIKNFYDFLKDYMPTTRISLGRAHIEKSYMDIIAVCSDKGIIASNLRIHLAEDIKDKIFPTNLGTEPLRFNDTFLSRYVASQHSVLSNSSPGYFMRIKNENRLFGGVFFFYDEDNPFTEEHTSLLHLLQPPLSLVLSNSLQCIELNECNNSLHKDNLELKKELYQRGDTIFIGKDTGLAHIHDKILKVAPIDINILITGETGVGKDIVALTIYKESMRKDKPYITVNCAAIAPSLIDSELFGHMKGSFTGAVQNHKGFFEQADGGTLFLDEIAELSLDSQSRLLRTLQDGNIRPVGSTKEVNVNFRLIAATNQNLERKIQEGLFREDLYFRIKELSIEVPPLRHRLQDIPLFVHYFITMYSSIFNMHEVRVSEEEMRKLTQYRWPGNVRELQNIIKSTLAMSKNTNITFQSSELNSMKCEEQNGSSELASDTSSALKQESSAISMMTYKEVQRLYFVKLLEYTKGKIKGDNSAAYFADLNPSTLNSKLNTLGIVHGKKIK